MTDPSRRGTTAVRRTLPPPGSPRLWLALLFRVVPLGVLLWVSGVCVETRQWAWLVVAVAFAAAQAALLRLFIRAIRRHYGGLLKAPHR